MHWLNLLVVLLLGAGLVALLLLAAADLLGLLRGSRWRLAVQTGVRAVEGTPGPPATAAPDESCLAWILYLRGEKVEHRQPIPLQGSTYIGREAYRGLAPEVAFQAAEVAWRDGMPAVRNLDPACPLELGRDSGGEPLVLDQVGEWEFWPADAFLRLGGCVLRWRESEEPAR